MKDEFLFRLLPYVALVLFLMGGVVRWAGSRWVEPSADGWRPSSRSRPSWSWRVGIAGVVAGHGVGLFFPQAFGTLHTHPRLLLTVDAASVLFGALAVAGLAMKLAAGAGRRLRSPVDTLGLTILGVALVSGLAIALVYRGAPSWYGTVLVPYLRSICLLEPRPDLVALMPFWLRLHVVAGFLLLGVAPWTSVGRSLAARRAPGTGTRVARETA